MVTTMPKTQAEERQYLQNLRMNDLRAIASRIGANSARDKASLVSNIIGRANEQGIGFSGYIGALDLTDSQAAIAGDEEVESGEAESLAEPTTAEESAELDEAVAEAEASNEDNGNLGYFGTKIKHFMFTVDGNMTEPDALNAIYDTRTVNREVSQWLQAGYVPVDVFTAGYTPQGHRLGWVLEKQAGEPKYTEVSHVMRTLTDQANEQIGSVTGFQADAYLSSLVEDEGWKLIGVRQNGLSADGLYMVWFLVR